MSSAYDVIVIGGGPSGSSCATLLAQAGRSVLLLERESFPRFHIGESLTAWAAETFERLGVYEELRAKNYIEKRGLEFVLPEKSKKIYFAERLKHEPEHRRWAFQMPRATLDEVLLRNAAKHGVTVRERCAVRSVLFEGERAVGVAYRDLESAEDGTVLARWVVDATGQSGVLNRQFGDNCYDDFLLNDKIAVFSHWRGDIGFVNGPEELNFRLCVHPNRRDWCWFLPLDRDLVSLGMVIDRAAAKGSTQDLEALFHEYADAIPVIREFFGNPTLERVEKFRGIQDFSYRSRRYYGPGWALTGDSAGFLDPIFSTGLQIAFNSALGLAEALNVVLDAPESDAARNSLEAYRASVDRIYRINSTLVYRFYKCGIDFEKMEKPYNLLLGTEWASVRHLARFMWVGAGVIRHPMHQIRNWAREVLFGNVSEGNIVAELFTILAENYEALNRKRIAVAEPRQSFIERQA